MAAPVAPAEKRTPSSLAALFWVGVGLAPLAALILLVADGDGSLRFGAVLAILAVVLIGLSIALRAESGGGGAGAEELRDEIEQLRHELRGEIVAAAQRGNQALDQAQRAQETVTALRRRLDAAAAGMAAAAASAKPAAEEPAGGRARVPAAETYDEGRSRHRAAPEPAPAGGGQHSGWAEDDSPRRPQLDARYGADRPQPGVYGASRAAEPDGRPDPRPVGVVHHTETVHVTTRHTIVDGGADRVAGSHYGGYAGRWSPVSQERPGSGVDPQERSRSGYREPASDRDGAGGDHARPAHAGSWSGPVDERSWSGPVDERSWSGPVDERSWSATPEGPAISPGPADERWQPAGRDGRRDDQFWSGGPDGPRGEGFRAGRAARPDGWERGGGGRASTGRPDDGWERGGEGRASSGRPDEWERGGDAGASPDVRARTVSEPSRRAAADDPDGEYWSELRAGNRWASVRNDERGREIRVGERHAAVHAAEAGTEYRVEDRWASVREPRRDHGGPMTGGPGWAEEGRPALPAGGVPVPDEWRPPTQRSAQPDWRPPTQRSAQPDRRRTDPTRTRHDDHPPRSW